MLFSHPTDFTPVCTAEFMAFAKHYPEFQKLNCLPLIAVFNLSNGAQGYLSTRIKMGSTSNVIAVIKTGALVPALHITNVTATVNDKQVLDAQWGGGISKNPYLAFKVKGAVKGDKVVVNWVDHTGDKNSVEAAVG